MYQNVIKRHKYQIEICQGDIERWQGAIKWYQRWIKRCQHWSEEYQNETELYQRWIKQCQDKIELYQDEVEGCKDVIKRHQGWIELYVFVHRVYYDPIIRFPKLRSNPTNPSQQSDTPRQSHEDDANNKTTYDT